IRDIASALEYIHGMLPPIIHGDLHVTNILVDAEGRGLLSDFGLSRIKHELTRTSTDIFEGGRERYLAPELLLLSEDASFRTHPASDCYAFGMTIFELATLQKPFAQFRRDRAASNAAEKGCRPSRPSQETLGMLSTQAADMLWELLTVMWAHEPSKRPSM
ncbi:kinase-like protein, partial [Clavulina sp. PMI_390]